MISFLLRFQEEVEKSLKKFEEQPGRVKVMNGSFEKSLEVFGEDD